MAGTGAVCAAHDVHRFPGPIVPSGARGARAPSSWPLGNTSSDWFNDRYEFVLGEPGVSKNRLGSSDEVARGNRFESEHFAIKKPHRAQRVIFSSDREGAAMSRKRWGEPQKEPGGEPV